MFAGKKRMGAERAEENGGNFFFSFIYSTIYLFRLFIRSFSHF